MINSCRIASATMCVQLGAPQGLCASDRLEAAP
jgi:hypothetical protein